jgi:hypothetical protein
MIEPVPEFSSLAVRGVFDGELVAFGNDGLSSFDPRRRGMLRELCVDPLRSAGRCTG